MLLMDYLLQEQQRAYYTAHPLSIIQMGVQYTQVSFKHL